MWYFLVTLTYRCPENHGNRVHRVYQESDQAAVKMRISRDHLICYSCPSGSEFMSAEIEFESDPISELQFKQLNVLLGADFSSETFS
jgi:hypothetical protein